ncbi:MAG: hypothetical protein K2P81_06520 [Bacteriovoracaceae bacterium]|nr:hypothetical protein [Bacteriovoracaceae bacterium]
MKVVPALAITSLLMTMSPKLLAAINVQAITRYADAGNADVWKGVKTDDVPLSLVSTLKLNDPSNPYSRLFPKAFFQENDFVVCYKNCDLTDAKNGKDALEQQNVFYWVTNLYKMAKERFDLSPSTRMKVMVNREVRDPGSSKVMRNNAFFNPADGTLSFLPASANPLAALLGAEKLNRSGFDPSVVAHEAGHSLFHRLFPNAINSEIDGFNEGFADYMANILMDRSEVGLVMMRGKSLRDSGSLTDASGKMKLYAAGLEAHDMGERFATGLWLSRAEVTDKLEFDRMVIDAVSDVSKSPFATGHGFKEALLARVQHTYESQVTNKITAIWELLVSGSDRRVEDTSFLQSKVPAATTWGLRVQSKFPESVSRELGIKNEISRFTYIKSVATADNFIAHLVAASTDDLMTPYWILVDPTRQNALGAWNLDGSPVEEENLQEVAQLTKQLMSMKETLSDFISKATMFTELAQGKGDLSGAYKVTNRQVTNQSMIFAGRNVSTVVHKLSLKRKLLARLLFGIPNIKSVTVITLPGAGTDASWPSLDGATVIGISMELEDGTQTETVFERVKKLK